MTFVNMILCSIVFVLVVAPLYWAIVTGHRDEHVAIAEPRLDRSRTVARRTRRQSNPQPRVRSTKHGQARPTS